MENDPEYTFDNIEELITFVQWLQDNFSTPHDYEEWFEIYIDDVVPPEVFCTRSISREELLHPCPNCKAKFSTEAGLDIHMSVLHKEVFKGRSKTNTEFWEIINNSFNNEDQNEQHEDSISDTD
jgi:hypothetical protein